MNLRTKLLAPILLTFLVFVLIVHLYWRHVLLDLEGEKVVEREQNILHNTEPGLLRDLLAGDLGSIYVTLDRMREINADEDYQIELINSQGKRLYPFIAPMPVSSHYIIELEQPLESEHHLLGTLIVRVDWTEQYELG